jgi:uncharacterized protein VirK/YbjX
VLYSLIRNTKYVAWNYRKESFSSLFSYYSRGVRIFFYLAGHLGLSRALKPFSTSGFISPKIYFIYLFKYLSNSLNTKEKLGILANHYAYFKKQFPYHVLKSLFSDGLVCWSESRGQTTYEMKLISTTPYENEGSLCMLFTLNDTILYRLAFTFAPGKIFGLLDEQIFYITRLQGVRGCFHEISKSTKFFNDVTPPAMLVSAIEGMALALGIKTVIGISLENQISYLVSDRQSFQKNYNEFWKTYDSVKIYNGDYLMPLPMQHKDIGLIKSNHRGRTVNKRKTRQDVSRKIYYFFANNVFTAKRIPISSMQMVKGIKATA